MKWLKDFQLYLFDLDGLLVNTESIHYQAYIDMLKKRGFNLDWSFLKFCTVAHFDDESLKEGIYKTFPPLFELQPNWEVLRKEKNKIYLDVLNSSKVDLMPGAENLLKELEKQDINRCIVTNSSKQMLDMIIAKAPVLKSIPHFITRECYTRPKPFPDSYQRAISLLAKKGDRIIGFEDSIRGIKALMQTSAISLFITQEKDPRADHMMYKDVFYFASIEDLPDDKLL